MGQLTKIMSSMISMMQGAPGNSVIVECVGRGAKNSSGELYHTPGLYSRPVSGDIGLTDTIGENRIVIAVNDYRFTLQINDGESVLYSRNASGVLQSKVWMKSTGEILIENNSGSHKIDTTGNHIINSGTISAVKFDELKTGFDQLKADFNSHTHPTAALGPPSTPSTPSSASIDTCEVTEVKLP